MLQHIAYIYYHFYSTHQSIVGRSHLNTMHNSMGITHSYQSEYSSMCLLYRMSMLDYMRYQVCMTHCQGYSHFSSLDTTTMCSYYMDSYKFAHIHSNLSN